MEMTTRSATFAKVVIILATDPSHDLFKTGQLVFEVLDGVMQNVEFRGLLTNHLTKVAMLTES